MTKRQFVVIAFRLFALYLGFVLISSIGFLFNSLRFPGFNGGISEILAPSFAICITLFLISLLWRKSEWLMQKVFAIPILSDQTLDADPDVQKTEAHENDRNPDNEAPLMMDYYETPISIESIELVAFSLLGLWAAMSSIPALVKEINSALENPIYQTVGSVVRWSILPHIIELGLGIWLFLRPWQFQGWIEKFKPKDDSLEEGHPTAP
jgi:hypothetical protein